jgi:hypothetical protein
VVIDTEKVKEEEADGLGDIVGGEEAEELSDPEEQPLLETEGLVDALNELDTVRQEEGVTIALALAHAETTLDEVGLEQELTEGLGVAETVSVTEVVKDCVALSEKEAEEEVSGEGEATAESEARDVPQPLELSEAELLLRDVGEVVDVILVDLVELEVTASLLDALDDPDEKSEAEARVEEVYTSEGDGVEEPQTVPELSWLRDVDGQAVTLRQAEVVAEGQTEKLAEKVTPVVKDKQAVNERRGEGEGKELIERVELVQKLPEALEQVLEEIEEQNDGLDDTDKVAHPDVLPEIKEDMDGLVVILSEVEDERDTSGDQVTLAHEVVVPLLDSERDALEQIDGLAEILNEERVLKLWELLLYAQRETVGEILAKVEKEATKLIELLGLMDALALMDEDTLALSDTAMEPEKKDESEEEDDTLGHTESEEERDTLGVVHGSAVRDLQTEMLDVWLNVGRVLKEKRDSLEHGLTDPRKVPLSVLVKQLLTLALLVKNTLGLEKRDNDSEGHETADDEGVEELTNDTVKREEVETVLVWELETMFETENARELVADSLALALTEGLSVELANELKEALEDWLAVAELVRQ